MESVRHYWNLVLVCSVHFYTDYFVCQSRAGTLWIEKPLRRQLSPIYFLKMYGISQIIKKNLRRVMIAFLTLKKNSCLYLSQFMTICSNSINIIYIRIEKAMLVLVFNGRSMVKNGFEWMKHVGFIKDNPSSNTGDSRYKITNKLLKPHH